MQYCKLIILKNTPLDCFIIHSGLPVSQANFLQSAEVSRTLPTGLETFLLKQFLVYFRLNSKLCNRKVSFERCKMVWTGDEPLEAMVIDGSAERVEVLCGA